MLQARLNNQKGESMIEIILITALFAVIGTGIVSTLLAGSHASKQGGDYVIARGYIGEAFEAVKSIRDQAWNNVVNGAHGLTTVGSKFAFSGASESLPGGFTRTVTIADVYRTGSLNGDIASSGVLDTNTKKVSINVVWTIFATQMKSLTSIFYVTHWTNVAWVQTLFAEFSAGFRNSSTNTSASGGEIALAPTSASWTGLMLRYTMDANGTGNMIASSFNESHNWLVTLQATTTGNELQVWDTSDVSNASPTLLRGMNLTQGADLVVSGDYAYVAASDAGTAGAEIVVVNLLTMATVSTVNLPQSNAGTAIAIDGTTLVIGRANNASTQEVFFYNVSNPASPILIGSTELGFAVTDLAMNSQYVFVASASNTAEVTAINVSTRSVVQTLNLSTNTDAMSVLVYGTDVYVGRAISGATEELVKLDGSDPADELPVTASQEIGSTVNNMAIDPQGTTLVLATSDSSGEGVLLKSSDLSVSQTINIPGSNVTNTASIYGTNVYLGSSANAGELIVFGFSSGGSFPDYAHEAIFTSQAFDATAVTSWDSLDWTTSGTGTVQFMIRTADSQAHLLDADWVGPLGTSATRYTTTGTAIVTDPAATGKRWIQFEAILSGNGSSTPSVLDVSASYTP